MKYTIAFLCLFAALASCQDQTETAPPPGTIPYGIYIVHPNAQWRDETSGLDISFGEEIKKKTGVKGECSIGPPDSWGNMSIAIIDTTRRTWSYHSITHHSQAIFKQVIEIVKQNVPNCSRLSFSYASNNYRYNHATMAVTFDTLYPALIKDSVVRNKLMRVKRRFQGICDTLTKQFKAYDHTMVELHSILNQGKYQGLAVFTLQLDSTKVNVAGADSIYHLVIPNLIADIKLTDPFFTQARVIYDGDYCYRDNNRPKHDTLFISP